MSTTVKLLKPHTHAGEDLQPGDIITFLPATANYLVRNGIAEDHIVSAPPKKLIKNKGGSKP